MTARSCVFQIYQPNSQNGKQAAVWSVTVFCVCFFFISIREQSGQRLFFFCLLDAAIFHFSLFVRASLVLHIIGTSSAFVKKAYRIVFHWWLFVALKNFKWPPKKSEGGKHGPQNYWPGDNTVTLTLHGRMYYLPKFEAYINRWDPQFQWWDPHHIQSWVPRTPKHSTWCKTLPKSTRTLVNSYPFLVNSYLNFGQLVPTLSQLVPESKTGQVEHDWRRVGKFRS